MKDVVAVDGPAGAGKSTAARRLATHLGFLYVDTGAMYRALTLKAVRGGRDVRDGAVLGQLAHDSDIELKPGDNGPQVLLDGRDVTAAVREPKVDRHVSQVAACSDVREAMVGLQRRLAQRGRVVLEGRDIGTHVVPEAAVKFFLTASLDARAARRLADLRDGGHQVTRAEVRQRLARRDRVDSSRAVAPLRQAGDAVVIDTTELSVDEVVERMMDVCRSRLAGGAVP